MSSDLIIFLSSMLPIIELRGAIPLGVFLYDMSIYYVFILAVIGNIMPVFFIIKGLDLLINKFLIHKIYIFNRFLNWLFEKTKKKHSKKFENWKNLALVLLVAIPLPFTGAWTGAIAAFVFGIPIKRALPLIALGVLIAGIIVSLITIGVINLPLI